MSRFSNSTYLRSRDPKFLTKAFVAIFGTGIALAFLLDARPGAKSQGERLIEALTAMGARETEKDVEGSADPEAIAKAIRTSATHGSEKRVRKIVSESALTPDAKAFFGVCITARMGKPPNRDAARSELKAMAEDEPPRRFAAAFMGDLLSAEGDFPGAIDYFEREGLAHQQASYSRERAIKLAVTRKLEPAVERLSRIPEFAEHLSLDQRVDVAVILKDYKALFRTVTEKIAASFLSPSHVFLTLIAALVWGTIVIQTAGFRNLGFSLLAFVCGVISVIPTLVFVILQDERFGDINGDPVNDLIYFVAGVALREEVSKVLLFLPVLPLAIMRRSPLAALVLGSMVGLGFGIEENIQYYHRFGLETSVKRIGANFLHLALTGVFALSVYRFAIRPKFAWEQLVATFLGVVTLHGCYNFFASLGGESAILSLGCLGGLAYYYFNLMVKLRETDHLAVSPLAVYVIGMAILSAAAMVTIGWTQGASAAISATIGALATTGIISLVFIYIFRTE